MEKILYDRVQFKQRIKTALNWNKISTNNERELDAQYLELKQSPKSRSV